MRGSQGSAARLLRKTRTRGRIFRANENGARGRRLLEASACYAVTRTSIASAMRSTAFLMFSIEVAKEMRR